MRRQSLIFALLSFLLVAGCGGPGGDVTPTDAGPGADADVDAGMDSGPPPNPCGNGTVEAGEECDDGNNDIDDGCDAACQIEPGGDCTLVGMTSDCTRCGNGILETGVGGSADEACDDGNMNDGDGCSATCTLEPGAACNDDPASPECWFCGDNVVDTDRELPAGTPDPEMCDDGGRCSGANEAMGASPVGTSCLVGNSTSCNGFPQDCAPVAGDGCDESCHTEGGWACTVTMTTDGMGNPITIGGACSRCGDGVREQTEVCDTGAQCDGTLDAGSAGDFCLVGDAAACNGNPTDCVPVIGDGCLADCSDFEDPIRYICSTSMAGLTTCTLCGDGVADGTGDQCDNGAECDGTNAGTGASPAGTACLTDDAAACGGFPQDCFAVGGDGCSATCIEEPGWSCEPAGGACSSCGDGMVSGSEACDDGGRCADGSSCLIGDAAACGGNPAGCTLRNGDGCNSSCNLELGWLCDMSTPNVCGRCGDGAIQAAAGETCDDRARCSGASVGSSPAGTACTVGDALGCGGFPADCAPVAGDGCDASCVEEMGWTCIPQAGGTVCQRCGDGIIQGTEQCDDVVGVPVGGDGCSATCTFEANHSCDTAAVPTVCYECGDGVTDPTEACDDGNQAANDGCNSLCRVETASGWVCAEDSSGTSLCSNCGNNVVEQAIDGMTVLGETCDDGQDGDDADGCLDTCQQDTAGGWECTFNAGTGIFSGCKLCGNGALELDEECDTGALGVDDGCTDSCAVDAGWTCLPDGSACGNCGDGVLQAATEQCDLGTNGPGTGCTATCQVDSADGWSCNPAGDSCSQCGDGVLQAAFEACDDGGRSSGDGCDRNCQVESGAGWTCDEDSVTGLSTCSNCGNNIVESTLDSDGMTVLGETCDDGQDGDDADGCLDTCQADTAGGWECTSNMATGVFTGCKACGNGTVELDEECDTGALGVDDGCTDNCAVDVGWTCLPDGSACGNCGDGVLQAALEQCDLGINGPGTGCTATCQVDSASGWRCDMAGTTCAECGDGVVQAALEACDDGARLSGDGCDLNCQVESGAGWTCSEDSVTGLSTCSNCGNGVVESALDSDGTTVLGETCDDRNGVDTPNTDGCIACQVDVANGWECTTTMPGALVLHGSCFNCGNGFLEPAEGCDDGDTTDGDGCSGTTDPDPANHCQVETAGGWSCQSTGAGGLADPVSVCLNCGDGVVQSPLEECDLGPFAPNTGCTASCQVDSLNGWSCDMAGTSCQQCGDGNVDAAFGEECDDGARFSGDGCRFDCTVETGGWVCVEDMSGLSSCSKCGDGKVEGNETCDDRNAVSGDGCAGTEGMDPATWCQEEAGYQCHLPGFDCAQCGLNGLELGEACDDGNSVAGDGCDDRCQLEGGNYDCSSVGTDCTVCGDGVTEGNEECDDMGGTTCSDGSPCDPTLATACSSNPAECTPDSDDGCSSTCTVEDGYNCDGMGTCSAARCGDGVVAGGEECDDGSDPITGLPVPGDGCSVICTVEDGYVCVAGSCRLTVCGDGALEGDESCDDGNLIAGDGCTNCVVDPDYACPTPGQLCVTGLCGDGNLDAGEECDDAYGGLGIYCDLCKLQPDSYCPVPDVDCDPMMPGDCDCITEVCGNSMRRGDEECDDGGTMPGDGCSATCTVEPLWRCSEDAMLLSTCDPVAEFVEVLQFNVSSVSANGIYYDPRTRSFIAHKEQNSQDPLELCLDGAVIDPSDGAFVGGTVFLPDGTEEQWNGGFRPRTPSSAVDGAAYNQFNGTVISLEGRSGYSDLYVVPIADLDRQPGSTTTSTAMQFGLLAEDGSDVANGSFSLIGEDGRLYVAEDSTRDWCNADDTVSCGSDADCTGAMAGTTCVTGVRIHIFAPDATCDGTAGNLPGVDCSGFVETGTDLQAVDSFGVDSSGGSNVLDVGYVIPGADIFATAYQLGDSAALCPIQGTTTCSQYHFFEYDAQLDPATGFHEIFASSTVPGTLFVDTSALQDPGDFPLDTILTGNNPADGAETATDGGAFVVCSSNPSDACRLYSRGCATDADCAAVSPGSICFDPDPMDPNDVPYCKLEGQARDDRYSFTAVSIESLTVMDNDILSENVCSDRRVGIRSLSTTDTDLQGRLNVVGECSGDGSACSFDYADITGGTIDADCTGSGDGDICLGQYVEWAHPGTCGTVEVFDYDALLGGGELDTATVRVTPECVCGDGLVAPSEQCDPNPVADGPERCNVDCTFNIVCGDSITDVGEECDDGATCNDTSACDPRQATACGSDPAQCTPKAGDGCGATCVAEFQCGNMVVELGEQCDDGNTANEDGCSASCQNEICGDGTVQAGLGEECEPPNVGSCDGFCQNLPVCGDLTTEGSEACDDGGICDDASAANCAVGLTTCPMGGNCLPTSGDGCDASCQPEFCGDGIVQPGLGEACDYALTPATCSFSCEIVTCGDGVISGSEQCDDNNTTASDGCSDVCALEYCGDGVLQDMPTLSEGCDDGNTANGDGCTSGCVVEFCGDGVINYDGALMTVDECDDGGNVAEDGCSDTCIAEFCGDGTIQAGLGEACEPGDFDMVTGATCQANCLWGNYCGDGTVGASEQCDDGNNDDDDGCSSVCVTEFCGDGVQQAGEACEDGNGASGDGCSATCVVEFCGDGVVNYDVGLVAVDECDDGGNVDGDGCSANCVVEFCGDGSVQAGLGEECEAPQVNMMTGASCLANCTWGNYCGDGAIGGDEQCDDGNAVACGDGCTDDCRVPSCGDGILECGEACELSGPDFDPDCTMACVIERCGNTTVDAGEECDDGNQTPGDGCSATCQNEWVCGNGTTDPGEACDPMDPATMVNPATGANCVGCVYEPVCGDGTVNQMGEQCDDGNTTSEDGCSATCQTESCGDGTIQGGLGEQCEPPNVGNCSAVCTLLAFCGNGTMDAGEECDDGNTVSEDGCSSMCDDEFCGDGVVQAGLGETCEPPTANCDPITCTVNQVCGNGMVEGSEECDDGGLVSGDGCSAVCEDEYCGDGILQAGLGEGCDEGSVCTDGMTDCTDDATVCAGIGDGSCNHAANATCSAACGVIIP